MAAARKVVNHRPTCQHLMEGQVQFELDWDRGRAYEGVPFPLGSFSVKNYEGINWSVDYSCTGVNSISPDLNLYLTMESYFIKGFLCIFSGWVLNNNSQKVCKISRNAMVFRCRGDKLSITHSQRAIAGKIKVLLEVKLTLNEETCNKCLTGNNNTVCLAKDIGHLLEKESGDVSFRVGDKKVMVHKAILMARSPVFAAIVAEGNGHIFIQDVDWDVAQKNVRYMYTDQVQDIQTNVRKLYLAACKLEMSGLKELCEEEMEKSLTAENASVTLIIADSISRDWKTRVIEFMKTNFEEVKATAGFKSLVSTHPQHYLELSCALLGVDAPTDAHK